MSPDGVVKIDRSKADALLDRVKEALPEEYESLKAFFDTMWFVLEELQKKNASIERLKNMMFGASTEKTSRIFEECGVGEEALPKEALESDETKDAQSRPPKGHGRLGAKDYPGAKRRSIKHESLEHGKRCPSCAKGNVYEEEPAVVVLLRGQAPIDGEVIEIEKFRCGTCGEIFSAKAPVEASGEKYDETAGSMLALLKYGTGMPFNYLIALQKNAERVRASPAEWLPWNYEAAVQAARTN